MISRLYLSLCIAAVAATFSFAAPALAGTAAEDFAASDADRNGTLSAPEFRAYIALAAAAKREQAVRVRDGNLYDRAFARIDANRDGQLSRAEMAIE